MDLHTFYRFKLHYVTTVGGWPLVGVDLGTTWDINDRQGLLLEKLYGNPAFFSLGVSIDLTNTSRNILTVNGVCA